MDAGRPTSPARSAAGREIMSLQRRRKPADTRAGRHARAPRWEHRSDGRAARFHRVGVHRPQALGWDAYAGIDMSGKIAVVLANDPDFEAGRDLDLKVGGWRRRDALG